MVFAGVLLSSLLVKAQPVEAGFFTSWFRTEVSAGEEGFTREIKNSQTMLLLQAAVNIDPNPAKGGGDITAIGGGLLAAAEPA